MSELDLAKTELDTLSIDNFVSYRLTLGYGRGKIVIRGNIASARGRGEIK